MEFNTLSVAEATQTAAQNRNLSTDPKRIAVIKLWEAMMRGARKDCEEQGYVLVNRDNVI